MQIGIWLEKLDGARNWLTTTINMQECAVRLETVLNANLEMRGTSFNNPLPKRLKRNSALIAKDRGSWRMSDDDDVFLIEESRNRECGNEFDEELALNVRQQENEAKVWQQAKYVNHDSGEESDDLCESSRVVGRSGRPLKCQI